MQQKDQRPPDDFARAVLDDAGEDLIGAYEVLGLANAWYPGWPMSWRRQLAEQTLATLVREGLVTLCRGNWEDAADHPVPRDELDAVLRDPATWFIPEGVHVFLYTTDKGLATLVPQQGAAPADGGAAT